MKVCPSILVIIALSASPLTSAEDRASNDLNTLLRDASYIFNRFEEMSFGVEVQIDTNYPANIRKVTKEALSDTLANVEVEKLALNALLGHSKVSSVDLLDVYTEMVDVSSELEIESSNSSNWGDQKLGTDLAQLSAKASVLGAKLAVAIKSQITAQELQLVSCIKQTPAHKPK
jgi:hypothetical protein